MQVAHLCLSRLEGHGLEVEGCADFERVPELISQSPKDYLTPKLSPGFNDFTRESAFWLFLRKEGEVVGGVGARLDDLGSEPVSAYWRRTHNRQYPIQSGAAIASIDERVDQFIGGKLVYIGDLFVAPGLSVKRSVSRPLVHFLYALILDKWTFDYAYSFVRDADLIRGAQYQYGMSRTFLWPQTWVSPPPAPRANSECLLYAGKDDLAIGLSKLAAAPDKL